jgi:TolA-binding protein
LSICRPSSLKQPDLYKRECFRIQEINDRIRQAQEEIKEFQNEFEIMTGDKSEKFRELKAKDAQMSVRHRHQNG